MFQSKLSNKTKESIRFLYDIKPVLYDQKWVRTSENRELYYIHRGVKNKGELRYDFTIIPSQMLGQEFNRTKGNRNSKHYQELYIVLKGRAIFLMQKTRRGRTDIIEDIIAVEARKGESVIFPPRYAAITINPGKQELKIANWVSIKNNNVYKELLAMKGPGYFYTSGGWKKNKNYKIVPELRFGKPLKQIPKNLDFLK